MCEEENWVGGLDRERGELLGDAADKVARRGEDVVVVVMRNGRGWTL